jgi:hypothetical protein
LTLGNRRSEIGRRPQATVAVYGICRNVSILQFSELLGNVGADHADHFEVQKQEEIWGSDRSKWRNTLPRRIENPCSGGIANPDTLPGRHPRLMTMWLLSECHMRAFYHRPMLLKNYKLHPLSTRERFPSTEIL